MPSSSHLPRLCLHERALVAPGYHHEHEHEHERERDQRFGGGVFPGWRWVEHQRAGERARLLDFATLPDGASTSKVDSAAHNSALTPPMTCCGMHVPPLTSNSFTCIVVSLLLGLSLLLTALVVCVTALHATAVISPTLSATTKLINNVNVQTSTLGNETALLMGSVQDHWSIPAMTLTLNPDAAPAAQEQARTGDEPRVVTNLGRGGGRRSLFERLLSRR